jgi:hypothetical protein
MGCLFYKGRSALIFWIFQDFNHAIKVIRQLSGDFYSMQLSPYTNFNTKN